MVGTRLCLLHNLHRSQPKIVVFLIFLFSLSVSNALAEEAVLLKLNVPVSRELKSGERHFYSVKAAEKEFVEIVCRREGVDVVLSAFSRTGEKVSVSNAPGGFAGFDRLAFVAEEAGDYRIELASRRPGNIVGNYSIALKDERAATENDSMRADAMDSLGEAREIMHGAENRVEKAARAIEKLEKSLALFKKSNDPEGAAAALFHIAFITANEYGDEIKAVEIYEKALRIWGEIDDEAGRAICLMHAARELKDKGEIDKAFAYINEALVINRKSNDRLGEAASLSYLCRFYNDTGNFQKGFEACRESLRHAPDVDPLTDYFTYNALAALYANTGDLEKSLEYFRTTLGRLALTGGHLNPIRQATVKSNIGAILFTQKKYEEALASHQAALLISRMVKRPKFEAYFLNQISLSFYELKQFQKALEYGEKSLALYRLHYARNRQIALNNVGRIYAALGQNDKARETLLGSLEMNRQNKDRYAEAETLYNLALLENRVGNLETAFEDMRQSINISEILRADLLGKNQRSSYLKILKRYYELDIELLVKLFEKSADAKYLEQAWQSQEKIRARSLLENFLESDFDLNDSALKDFFKQEQNLLETIAAEELKRADAVKTKNAVARAAAETNLQKALEEYQILHEDIRNKNPRFSALELPKNFFLLTHRVCSTKKPPFSNILSASDKAMFGLSKRLRSNSSNFQPATVSTTRRMNFISR
jgi:tetratricopeptide (TPR) repeat protein